MYRTTHQAARLGGAADQSRQSTCAPLSCRSAAHQFFSGAQHINARRCGGSLRVQSRPGHGRGSHCLSVNKLSRSLAGYSRLRRSHNLTTRIASRLSDDHDEWEEEKKEEEEPLEDEDLRSWRTEKANMIRDFCKRHNIKVNISSKLQSDDADDLVDDDMYDDYYEAPDDDDDFPYDDDDNDISVELLYESQELVNEAARQAEAVGLNARSRLLNLLSVETTTTRSEVVRVPRNLAPAQDEECRVAGDDDADSDLPRCQEWQVDTLGMCTLLMALEEEAASMASMITEDGLSWGEAEEMRSLGSPSNWTLQRLDALAAEALSEFRVQMGLDAPGGGPEEEGASTEPGGGEGAAAVVGSAGRSVREQCAEYPVRAVEALNTVLFHRHGYHQGPEGDVRNLLLPHVIEGGSGSPVMLGILYMQVARRMGLQLEGAPLEGCGSDYFLMWPAEGAQPLKAGALDMVIDAFDGGCFWRKDEMLELFEVDSLEAPSLPEMVASLYKSLQQAHWAAATGTGPDIAFMAPLSLDAVIEDGGYWPPLRGYHVSRALAAAEMRVQIEKATGHCPVGLVVNYSNDKSVSEAALEYALLLFHAGRYEDAWMELGILADEASHPLQPASAISSRCDDDDDDDDDDMIIRFRDEDVAAWGLEYELDTCCTQLENLKILVERLRLMVSNNPVGRD